MARHFRHITHAAVSRLARGTKGQDIVEFALILPLLLLLLYGILEMGRAVYTYNILANIAREGARYGIILSDSNLVGNKGAGNCAAAPAGITAWACRIIVGLDPGQIRVTPTVSGTTVNVRVDYDFTFLAGPVIKAVGAKPDLALSARATMQREQF